MIILFLPRGARRWGGTRSLRGHHTIFPFQDTHHGPKMEAFHTDDISIEAHRLTQTQAGRKTLGYSVYVCNINSLVQEAIIWYTKHTHGNERLKVLGLQCLIHFHLHEPEGTLHEAIMPCLRELGQSSSVISRRWSNLEKSNLCALSWGKFRIHQILKLGRALYCTLLGKY